MIRLFTSSLSNQFLMLLFYNSSLLFYPLLNLWIQFHALFIKKAICDKAEDDVDRVLFIYKPVWVEK